MRLVGTHILIFFTTIGNSQQNLVLNPSCENYSTCPNALTQINLVENVINPNNSTPDFFHVCYTNPDNNAAVPGNFCGFQIPKSGDAYVGFGMFLNGNNIQEYITFELSDSLFQNKIYEISFYISKADSFKFAINRVGAYLSENLIYQNDYFYLNYNPQIENDLTLIITDEINWIKIEGEYIAEGGEKFITIGNFYPDSLTDTIAVNNDPISSSNKGGAYYYLDDISVTEILDTTDTVQPIDSTIFEINLFPNPNNGEFVLNYNLNDFTEGVFKIYNAIGQIVYEEKLMQNNGVRNLQLQLASGAYVWEVKSSEAVLKRERMIVTK